MNKHHIQFAGLLALFLLAAGLLILIGYTFANAAAKMTADGKVPLADAGLFTAFLLSFQQVVGAIRSIWESQERASMGERLGNSVPVGSPSPQTAKDAADEVAGAAQTEADKIKGE